MISKIRWKKGDFITLGKAVKNFNKKIDRIITEENKLYIPNKMNYNKLKQTIKTRAEFNNLVKSLKRFQKENAEDLFTYASGQKVTKWQKREIDIQMRTITRHYNQIMEQTSKTGYLNVEQRRYKRQMESLLKLPKTTGKEFKGKLSIIDKLSNASRIYEKSIIYKENMLYGIEFAMKNNEEFKKLYDYLEGINNPVEFFNTAEKSELLQDIFDYYTNPSSYGNFDSIQEMVDRIIDDLK